MTVKDPQAPSAPAKRSPQKRAKSWGYQVEVATLVALRPSFPMLRRTGSMAYKKAAADLIQCRGPYPIDPLRLVVTRDKRRPLLVTMSIDDFDRLTGHIPAYELNDMDVVVQVKGRERTWIGKLYDELKVATS